MTTSKASAPFLTYDTTQISPRESYALMIGAIVPRPIAFISTISLEGKENLAPFSFFNGVSSNPPTLSVAIARRADGSKKDTLLNIEATGEFVVNIPTVALAEKVVQSAAEYRYGTSEREITGLTAIPSDLVKPPRILEAVAHFECRLLKSIEVGDGSAGASTLILGTIVKIHMCDAVIDKSTSRFAVDYSAMDPLARLGGISYARIGEPFQLPVPAVAK